ncbi:hypothetical protein [Yinghuangia sp. YIM S09857]|uniref:hypothetical protein n=1 Tax=Yinghuangia sp. YIM S09857 TaxID=3436929 RepID=UPI003F531D8B
MRRLWTYSAGFAAGAVALGLFVAWTAHRLNGFLDENRAYGNARPCATSDPPRRDCLREVPAVVRAVIDVDAENNARHELWLTGEGFSHRSVPVRNSGEIIEHVKEGDTVVVTLWRDRAVEVRAGDRGEATRDTPGHDASMAVLALGVSTPLIPVFARLAVWLPRHRSAVVDNELTLALDAWGPTDLGLVAAAAALPVGYALAPKLGVDPGLTPQSIAGAALGTLAFVAAWLLTPLVKGRNSGHTRARRR